MVAYTKILLIKITFSVCSFQIFPCKFLYKVWHCPFCDQPRSTRTWSYTQTTTVAWCQNIWYQQVVTDQSNTLLYLSLDHCFIRFINGVVIGSPLVIKSCFYGYSDISFNANTIRKDLLNVAYYLVGSLWKCRSTCIYNCWFYLLWFSGICWTNIRSFQGYIHFPLDAKAGIWKLRSMNLWNYEIFKWVLHSLQLRIALIHFSFICWVIEKGIIAERER